MNRIPPSQNSTQEPLRCSSPLGSPVFNDEDSPPRQRLADPSPLLRRQENDYELEEIGAQDNVPISALEHAEQEHSDLLPSSSESAVESSLPNTEYAEWLPLSLTRVYLFSLAAVSMSLGICCFALVADSHLHNGLSNAGSSGGFDFNRKFLPTFVAVLYTLLWTPVVVDVIRTEPWALLSLPTGSRARDSLLQREKMWWSHLADAVRKKKRPGGVRWALLISVIASLVASIVINPLSAGFFDTLTLLVTKELQFSGTVPSTSGTQPTRIGDVTYLRAVTNLLFNVSTSAWNTNEYTVAPFWPSDLSEAPLTASLVSSPQLWRGNREVLVSQVKCRPFKTIQNSTIPYGDTVWKDLPYLQTDDGCAVVHPTEGQSCPGGVWGEITNTSSQATHEKCKSLGYREYFLFCSRDKNSTGLFHQGYAAEDKSYYAGQVCSTSYLTANIPVNVSTTSLGSVVSFDQASFDEAKKPMDSSYLNISDFEDEFIRQTGANHLRPTLGIGLGMSGSNEDSNFQGPALVLATSNNYSVDGLIQMDPSKLAQQAAIIKQRFLGEVLLSSFTDLAKANKTQHFQASMTAQQSRLVADLGVGITLAVFFMVLAGAAASLAFLVTLSKRPLELLRDPSKSSTAALSLNNTDASACFKTLDRAHPTKVEAVLQNEAFRMRTGKLIRIDDTSIGPASKPQTPSHPIIRRNWFGRLTTSPKRQDLDWRPFTLRRRSGSLLVLFLLCVLSALIAVYAVSRKRPLYQSAFVYASDVKVGGLNVTTLAPYSIIPTLVAVGIKLWWAAIDSAYRRLTPFLAMAKTPTPKASGEASLSYITTPILWITLLALRKRFWLLALVTLGSLTSEILQISMSSLWNRQLGVLEFDVNLNKQFEMRSVPHVFEDSKPIYRTGSNIAYPNIAQYLYGGELYQTSWEYGSLAEMAFGAFPPAWSKDGWNFPPVDISGVSKSLPNLPTTHDTGAPRSGLEPSLNVTFDSTGLRGRVECLPIDDPSRWVDEVKNLTGLKPYNNATKPNIRSGFEFTPEVRVINFTAYDGSQPTTVAIGQWLHFNYSSSSDHGDPLYKPGNQNFTVLWINASYPYQYERKASGVPSGVFDIPPRLIFAERPRVQALSCRPIFETSDARIVVNAHNGKIEDYTLLDSAKPTEDGWTDKFIRHFSNETSYYDDTPTSSDMDAIQNYNTTVSWGYLFQLALLQACNVQGFVTSSGDYLGDGIPGATPFSFIEPDMYSDPYSYASLALVNYDRTALLNATTLTTITQRVFSTFFQWFASSQSGYTGDYWAYQQLDAKLPADLDFGPVESWVTTTESYSRAETECRSTMSVYSTLYTDEVEPTMRTFTVDLCAEATSTSVSQWEKTETYLTIIDTRTTESSSSLLPTSLSSHKATASVKTTSKPKTTTAARLHKRTTPTDEDARLIRAKISIQTQTLVISSVALFLSVCIILLLILSTFIVFLVQNSQFRLLPRDFDSPASLLAAVYASEKLKVWSKRRVERGHMVDDDVRVAMGYFAGVDGDEHWGIEVVGEEERLLEKGREREEDD